MRFNKIFWGFLFFFDLRIEGFDILPDLIGYWLVYSGLNEIISLSGHFAQAKKYALILGFLSIFNIYEVKVEYYPLPSFGSFWLVLLPSIIIWILNLLMICHLCQGIAEEAKAQDVPILENLALKRWSYYFYAQLGMIVALLLSFLHSAVMAFVVLIAVISLIALLLIMGLMKRAESLLVQEP